MVYVPSISDTCMVSDLSRGNHHQHWTVQVGKCRRMESKSVFAGGGGEEEGGGIVVCEY